MKFRLPIFASALALVTMMAVSAPAAAASSTSAPASRGLAATVTGTTSTGDTLNAAVSNLRFSNVSGVLTVTGTLSGTLSDASGTTLKSFTNVPFTDSVTSHDPTCTILDLVLGPLHLDLLGLVVDLNQVHLTITAVSGPGQLLGNLLCAVANLLNNSNATLNALVNALNALLAGL
jgi:hypothetical protein